MTFKDKRFINENDEDTVIITPTEYVRYLEMANYNTNLVSKLPKFRNKKIIIDGSLSLKNTPIKILDNIYKVNGVILLDNSDVEYIGDIINIGIMDYNTPIELRRREVEFNRDYAILDEDRKYDTWNIEDNIDDDIIVRAHVMYKALKRHNPVSSEVANSIYIRKLLNRILELESSLKLNPDDTKVSDLLLKIQTEYDNYISKHPIFDVYCMMNIDGYEFKVVSKAEPYYSSRERYLVLTDDEATEIAREIYLNNFEEYIHITSDMLRNYLDVDRIIDDYEEVLYGWVSEAPEDYFNNDSYELTTSQKNEIDRLGRVVSELRDKLEDTEDFGEISEIEAEIENYELKIEEISHNNTISDEMIDEYVESWLNRIRKDPYYFLNTEMGSSIDTIKHYFNKEEYIDYLLDEDTVDQVVGNGEGSIGRVNVLHTHYNLYEI